MAKLTGSRKIRTAVFISGKGSNLENLIKFSFSKSYKPYVIGKIITGSNKVNINGKIDWF